MDYAFLNEKEKSVFTALRKYGNITTTELAKATLINRTTLYPIVERMIERGLLRSVQTEKTTLYSCLSQKEFQSWLDRKRDSMMKEVDTFLEWSKGLDDSTETLSTEMKYYEGFDAVKSLYDETWRNNITGIIRAITDYERAYETMGAFFQDDYFKMRVRKNIHVKSLLPDSKSGRRDQKRAKELLRDMKFIDLFTNLGIELNIFDDKVAIVAFDDQRPTGILMKNAVVARAFEEIFEYLWKTGKVK